MTSLTLAIRNARIVDGTGEPGYAGDVGVAGMRIVAIGDVPDRADVEIDAGGLVLAPGFIDIHTHYDPQLCWDKLATPTPEHGVTSIVVGNCSLSLAPVRAGGHRKITKLFGVVEDLDPSLFDAAVPFNWDSFSDYITAMRPGLGLNTGFLVGHAALRLYVMGADAQKRAASEAELDHMTICLREAIQAGAIGLSMTYGHLDENGHELPSRFADKREKLALCRAMVEGGRGVLELAADYTSEATLLGNVDELGELSLATGITCSLSPILHMPARGNGWLKALVRLEAWQARGARVTAQTQTRPLDQVFRLSHGSVALTKSPLWSEIMSSNLAERAERLADRKAWPALQAEIGVRQRQFFDYVSIKRIASPAHANWLGRKVTDIAAEIGVPYVNILIEAALADDLETEFEVTGLIQSDVDIVSLLISHPAMQIGSADAGAHISQFSGAGDTCFLLEHFVRKHATMTLEHAVQRLTSDLAKGWSIANRGEIASGKFADLVLFDPATIARGEEIWVDDVPGGGGRYIRRAEGIDKVIVNGQIVVDRGKYTEARPGCVI